MSDSLNTTTTRSGVTGIEHPILTIDAGREPWEIEAYAQHFDAIAERAQTRQDASSATACGLPSSEPTYVAPRHAAAAAMTGACDGGMALFSESSRDERGANAASERQVYPGIDGIGVACGPFPPPPSKAWYIPLRCNRRQGGGRFRGTC